MRFVPPDCGSVAGRYEARPGLSRAAPPRPVVVGIDGSKDAVRAAMWAADEASQRGTFVRLVHVITGHPQNRDRGFAHAGQILHKASEAVRSVNSSVIVDSDVFEGDLLTQLVDASRGAALICLGATNADSTVVQELRRSHIPVAVIGREGSRRLGHRHQIGSQSVVRMAAASMP